MLFRSVNWGVHSKRAGAAGSTIFDVEVDVTGRRLGVNLVWLRRLLELRLEGELQSFRLVKGELTSTSQMPALKVMSGDIDDMMASLGRWPCKRAFGEVLRVELDVGEDQAESCCPLESSMSARRQGKATARTRKPELQVLQTLAQLDPT